MGAKRVAHTADAWQPPALRRMCWCRPLWTWPANPAGLTASAAMVLSVTFGVALMLILVPSRAMGEPQEQAAPQPRPPR